MPDLGSSNPHFLVSAIDCWTLISLLSLLIPLFVVCLMSNLVISPQLYTSPTFPQCRKCWPNLCIIFRHTHFDLPIFVWMGYGTDLGSNPKIQALAVWNSFADQHLRVWTCFFEDPKKNMDSFTLFNYYYPRSPGNKQSAGHRGIMEIPNW